MSRNPVWMVLRNYQAADVERILAAWRTSHRVLYVLPTGAGKTHVAQAVAEAHPGARVLIVAHRREIVQQTADRFEGAAGVIMRGVVGAEGPSVQVASIQSLVAREMSPPCDILILDEAHHAEAKTWRRLVDMYPNAKVLGLTATPWTKGGRGLAGAFDEIVVGRTVSELAAADWLALPRAWTHGEAAEAELERDLSALPTDRGDWNETALQGVMNRRALVGSLVEHYQRLGGGHRAVAYATGLDHARAICDEFKAAGIAAEYLDGATPIRERAALLGRLRSGATRIVVNFGVLTEGWDMREAKVCICARPTRSLTLWLQMVGRFLRPWEGVTPIVLDHAGNVNGHGLPQDPREITLAGRARRRGAGGPVYKSCPACGESVLGFAAACACGHVFFDRAAVVEGELVEAKRRVCSVCGVPLGRPRKYRKPSGLCPRHGASLFMKSLSREQHSERARKAWLGMTPEQRSAQTRKMHDVLTPELRSAAGRAGGRAMIAATTHEQRVVRARAMNAAKTPEQRGKQVRVLNDALTPEQRSEQARKAGMASRNATTPEQRSAAGRAGAAARWGRDSKETDE